MPLRQFAYEEVTVSDTAVGLTATTYQPSGEQGACQAIITIEGGNIRHRSDGTNPTATVGEPGRAGGQITLESQGEIVDFKAIREASADATLRVAYYRKV